MTVERARTRLVPKPWGSNDLRPWSTHHDSGEAIGELWFSRSTENAPEPVLLLKILFTSEPLSIQVHPDDNYARSIGLNNGKSEAWYILSARSDASVALGLKRALTSEELRASIGDGSIENIVRWRGVRSSDVISVPAGTIHAVGAGLVIVEIQQRSDATFRLFDFGRRRSLHVDEVLAVARAEVADESFVTSELTSARQLLLTGEHFVLEHVTLPANSTWHFHATDETWLFVLRGAARIGAVAVSMSEVLFLQAENSSIEVGPNGLEALVTYLGSVPRHNLVHPLSRDAITSPGVRH